MRLKNPFSEKTRAIYAFVRNCQECGRCDLPLSLHHILSRVSNSPLNSIMLCDKCHTSGSYKTKCKFLVKSIKFLLDNDYRLTNTDAEFFEKYRAMYKKGEIEKPLK